MMDNAYFADGVKSSSGSALEIFKNDQFGSVRAVLIDGEPWFVGNDVAFILDYSVPKNAIRDNVDNEDKKVVKLSDIQEGEPEGLPDHMKGSKITIINESGLYSLIIRSNKPNAKSFKRWITSEVLPSIRKTGSYQKEEVKTPVFGSNPNPGSFEDTVRGTVVWIELVRQNLRLSESSALLLYTKAGDRLGLPVPDYVVAKDTKFSATTLLKMNNSPVSAKQFNRLMIEHGLLEEKERKSTSSKDGVKKFKSLTDEGLEFGENMISPHNEKETQPMYYEHKFKELLKLLGV